MKWEQEQEQEQDQDHKQTRERIVTDIYSSSSWEYIYLRKRYIDIDVFMAHVGLDMVHYIEIIHMTILRHG